MKHIALAVLTFVNFSLNAQTLFMKSGAFIPAENVKSINNFSSWIQYQYSNKTYCLVQFSNSTSSAQRTLISSATGIEFLDYFPDWAFLATIPNTFNVNTLSNYNIRSILPYEAKYKIAPKLLQRPFPTWMDKGNSNVEVLVEIQNGITKSVAATLFLEKNIEILSWKNQTFVKVQLSESNIQILANLPWVKYIQATSAPAVSENLTERSGHRVNTIDAAYVTGLHYNGTGVSVAIGDDGMVGPHIDFWGRLFDHTSSNTGAHGDHVTGIVGGGGNFDPSSSGNGRGSDLHIYSNYSNLQNAPVDYATNGIRITSNSLGQACNVGYDADARDADILINSKFSLMSVHSAGNSGTTSCGGVPGFYTITGGYKAGKNVIAVGNVDNSDVLNPSSSRGPSEDGRIKPEIVAIGTDVNSTQPDNTYLSQTGTSMSCPGVSGTLASLWDAYRQTHAGLDPYSGLIKALVMNSADDLGNKGPDYKYGFGRINARRALQLMNSNQYFIDSMTNGDARDYFINVPANTRQMKVMLYWNDFEGNPASSVALVNDLTLSVQEPTGNVIDPWILNTAPSASALNAGAVRGIDNINNVEQVTIDSLISGPCIISVYGNNVPVGLQKYTLVYEFINDQITLTYPQGGEAFVNARTERIRWDAHGNNGGLFTLEFSPNFGVSWDTISTTIPGNVRYYDWTPPINLNTGQMKMRISRGAFFDESDTAFTVFDVPTNLVVDTACVNIFHLSWDALPFATDYNIYMMGTNLPGTKYMTQIATSTTNEIYINTGVNMTDTFYFAVSGINSLNGAVGLRTFAYIKYPGNVNCVNDAYNVATILPFEFAYTCAISAPVPVKVKIKNIGLKALTNLNVFYQVNAGPIISELISGPIPIGDSMIYTFTNLTTMAVPNTYSVRTWTNIWTDIIFTNDTSQNAATVAVATTFGAPTIQDFEGPVFPPIGWRVVDKDTNVKWQKTLCFVDPTGFNSHTAYMDFFNYNNLNQIDDLETAQFDLAGITADTVLMTFDISHAYGATGIDSLQILISEDCGRTFTPTTYFKGGIPLATAGMMSSIFSPTLTTQWRNDRINLTNYIGKKIFLRFRGTNLHGNNLFIDNINIMLKDAWPLGTISFDGNDNVIVYPNPSDGNYTLEFNAKETKNVTYSIYNLTGQKVKQSRIILSSGITKAALDISNFASGMYILELNDGINSKKIKLDKY